LLYYININQIAQNQGTLVYLHNEEKMEEKNIKHMEENNEGNSNSNDTNLLPNALPDLLPKVPARMVHRAVRNIMFNELGLSRDKLEHWIKESIQVEVKHFIEHHLKDSELLHNQINVNIGRMMKEGVSNGTWYDNESFNHYIKRIIEQEVQKQFLQNYTIEIKPVSHQGETK
jgi:hypothetical protein